MIKVNEQEKYKRLIYDNRSFAFSALLNDKENIDVKYISQLEIEEIGISNNSLRLGQLCNNKVSFKLMKETNDIRNGFVRFEVSLNGLPNENISLGKFYITEYKDNHNGTFFVTGYALNGKWNDSYKSIESHNVQEILNAIEKETSQKILNKDLFTLKEIQAFPKDATNKELLGYIAGYDGFNLRIDRQGNIVPYKYSNDIVDEIGNEKDITFEGISLSRKGRNILSLKTTKEYVIGSVEVQNSNDEKGKVFTQGTGNSIRYYNPFISSDEQVPNYICNMSYVPLEAKDVGNPCREIGDRISFTDQNGETYRTWIMYQKFSIDGGMVAETKSFTDEDKGLVIKETPLEKLVRITGDKNKQFVETLFETLRNNSNGYFNAIDIDGNIIPITSKNVAGFQISNTPTITPTTKGWRFVNGGLYHSNDGFKTFDTFALNEDGWLNTRIIKSGSINADMLDVKSVKKELTDDISSQISNLTVENGTIRALITELNNRTNETTRKFEAFFDLDGVHLKDGTNKEAIFNAEQILFKRADGTIALKINEYESYFGKWVTIASHRLEVFPIHEWDPESVGGVNRDSQTVSGTGLFYSRDSEGV